MAWKPSLVCLTGLATLALPLEGQQPPVTVYLDLAAPVEERPLDPGIVSLALRHRVPGRQYRVEVRREVVPVRELDLEPVPTPGPAAGDCPVGEDMHNALLGTETEEQVREAIRDLRRRHSEGGCPDRTLAEIVAEAAVTEMHVGEFALRRGERLRVDVTRLATDTTSGRVWEFVLTTGSRGEWLVHYGFTFSTFFLNEDPGFFSRVNSDTAEGGFVVTEEERHTKDLDLAPSVLFTWAPASTRLDDLALGLTAGLGYKPDDPQLFAGPSLRIAENLLFTAGVLIHQVRRLDGQFEEGQIVRENLDEDALTERVFRPNLYFGLGFRFGQSPFGGGNGEPEEETGEGVNATDGSM